MAGKTNIEWAGHSWNPLAGCSVLTPGCTSCYAMKLAARLERMGQPLYAGLTKSTKGGAVWTGEMRRAPEATLLAPLHRKTPTTYFVNSMSDLFHENVPNEWIDQIFAVMALCPQHTFQVLTKRAERMRSYVSSLRAVEIAQAAVWLGVWDDPDGIASTVCSDVDRGPLPNVWLGVSTEDQKRADERIPELLRTPAAVRFISAEPLLGPINLEAMPFPDGDRRHRWSALTGQALMYAEGKDGNPDLTVRITKPIRNKLDWTIWGGESGPGFRHMDPAWARQIQFQCLDAGVAVFGKQMSGRLPIPEDLRVRQFPETRAAGKAA